MLKTTQEILKELIQQDLACLICEVEKRVMRIKVKEEMISEDNIVLSFSEKEKDRPFSQWMDNITEEEIFDYFKKFLIPKERNNLIKKDDEHAIEQEHLIEKNYIREILSRLFSKKPIEIKRFRQDKPDGSNEKYIHLKFTDIIIPSQQLIEFLLTSSLAKSWTEYDDLFKNINVAEKRSLLIQMSARKLEEELPINAEINKPKL